MLMFRLKLITKEKVKQAYQEKLKNEVGWKYFEQSIQDDLQTFFTNLQDQKEIGHEFVRSFFCQN